LFDLQADVAAFPKHCYEVLVDIIVAFV